VTRWANGIEARIGDVMIASIAIAYGLPLLTRNIIDFAALSDVLPEQWRLDVRAFPEQALR